MTGANSGLGYAKTKQLAERGAKVYMLCRNKGRGDAAQKFINGETDLKIVDMSSYESIVSLVMPGVDVLVHDDGALCLTRAIQ